MQAIAANASRHQAAVRVWGTGFSCARGDDGGILDLSHNRLASTGLVTILVGASPNLLHCGETKQAVSVVWWIDRVKTGLNI